MAYTEDSYSKKPITTTTVVVVVVVVVVVASSPTFPRARAWPRCPSMATK